MYKILSFILLLIFIVSCKQISSQKELFLKIKELEFNRIANLEEWNEIRNHHDFNLIQYSYVNSIGKTRVSLLIPILTDLLHSSQDDSLIAECIFALGQMGTNQAEQSLLDFPFENLTVKNKKRLIAALCHCATEKTVQFYQKYLDEPDIRSDIIINAAICARNKLNISEIKYAVVDSAALDQPSVSISYLLFYAGNINDLVNIIQIASNSNGLTLKYALKKLKQLLVNNRSLFNTRLTTDSISVELYSKTIVKSLKRNAPWQIQYYAIPLASILEDSILIDRISSLTKSKNPHVALTALEYLANANKELAISNLLDQFGREKNMYTRGHIIKILADHYPEKAYSFVMQNLDKGDSRFKAQLLDALAKIKSKMAINTLRQFVNVDDPILVCRAFENLKTLGLIKNSDVDILLDSNHFACVAVALGYSLEKNRKIETDKLKQLYKKFNNPFELEVQSSIIKMIKNNLFTPSSIPVDSLIANASHSVLKRKIIEQFPKSFSKNHDPQMDGFEHAKQTKLDSLNYYSNNPMVEIETNRGKVKIELYTLYAPYTVNSFIKLAQVNFYDGLTFHRIVPDFVSQGGDPIGSGWGGPDYLIPSEDNLLPYIDGSVGIATSGFDTGSSQFFICHSEQPHLNGNYTLFGQVVEGMNVVYSLLPEDKIITIKLL